MDGKRTHVLPIAGDIGERIRGWRRERGWTQAQLAKKAGLAPGTVSRLESGEVRPLGRTAHQLAEALGVEQERLLGLAGQPMLFPLPDERRVALTRALLALSDESIERAYPTLRKALEDAGKGRRARVRPGSRRKISAGGRATDTEKDGN